MKEIKRIDDTTVQIDGRNYYTLPEPEPVKPEWPTKWKPHMITGVPTVWTIDSRDMERHVAISKCMIIARAINGDWEPDWEDDDQSKWCPCIFGSNIEPIEFTDTDDRDHSFVWYPTDKACQHFIDHFGSIWLEAIG